MAGIVEVDESSRDAGDHALFFAVVAPARHGESRVLACTT
jgi:hypothetical protein